MRNHNMEINTFREYINFEYDGRLNDSASAATVAIIIYNSGEAVFDLIESLSYQTLNNFDIVIINNGKIGIKIVEKLKTMPIKYIENSVNSLSLGRNIAAAFAKGEILIYLDDDCIAHEQLVESHLELYTNAKVLGVQGKGLAYKHPFYCTFQSHYDLGPIILPSIYSFEGNISIRKETLFKVGGFDPQYFGGEGLKLSYRMSKTYKRNDVILYNPNAIIYHDFAKGLIDYLEKCYRHVKMRKRIEKEFPSIISFARSFGPYPKDNISKLTTVEFICSKLIGKLGQLAETFAKVF